MAFKKPHHVADGSMVKTEGNKWTFRPKGLNIVWGKDPRYWNIPPSPEEPATLIQVSWLEVSGSVKVPVGKYRVTFDVSLTGDSFGWSSPVLVMAKVGKRGAYKFKEVTLSPPTTSNNGNPTTIPPPDELLIDVADDSADRELYFGLYEVWSGKWKGGLKIYEARVEKV